MPGNFQVIQSAFSLPATSGQAFYLYCSFLGELNFAVTTLFNAQPTGNVIPTLTDGYGNFDPAAGAVNGVPKIVGSPPANSTFSSKGREYEPNDISASPPYQQTTTFSIRLDRIGNWLKIELENTDPALTASVTIVGEI